MGLFEQLLGKKKKSAPWARAAAAFSGDFSNNAPVNAEIGAKSPPPGLVAGNLLAVFKQAYSLKLQDGRQAIHVETLLSSLGAMAGFGCQIAVREGLVKTGAVPLERAFVVVRTTHGSKYFMGDLLNQPLLEAPVSVWAFVAGALKQVGALEPDLKAIVRHVMTTLGGPNFGRLSVAREHQPHEQPLQSLTKQWAAAYKLVQSQLGNPLFTGWYFAHAAQMLIVEAKDVIDPTLAAQIVMESAIAMAKVDPQSIGFEV